MSQFNAAQLLSVEGLVVVLTGGGTGLGRSTALALAENGAAKVFILGRREDVLQETVSLGKKDTIIPVQADITSKESLQAAYETVAAQTDHVDLLIANSGYGGLPMAPPKPKPDGSIPSLAEFRDHLWSSPEEDFGKLMEINVKGTFFTVVAFLPLLNAANERRPAPVMDQLPTPKAQVIIVGSVAGHFRVVPYSIAYNISKGAVHHLIKTLSNILTPYDIRVNGIAPGLFPSEMTKTAFGITKSSAMDGAFPKSELPPGRTGRHEEFAGLVLWMASPSGAYANGNITIIDGGWLSTLPSC
ncbi:hypothetical protein AtubIFM57143_009253 [Aspergillus tubingensis]|nr:hypothetical protein AtubIFM57143_009253 [Aspergillus tubingensis]